MGCFWWAHALETWLAWGSSQTSQRLAHLQSHLDETPLQRVRELLDQRQTFTVPERCDISHTQEPSDTEIDDRRRHRAWLITLEHAQAHGLIRKAARRETLDREEALPRVQLLVDTCTKLSYEDLVHPAGHTFRVVEEVDDRGGKQIIANRNLITLWGRSCKCGHIAGDTPHSAKTLRRAARETLAARWSHCPGYCHALGENGAGSLGGRIGG